MKLDQLKSLISYRTSQIASKLSECGKISDDQIFVYFCNQIPSILQGPTPTCGLVSLLMAEDMLFGASKSGLKSDQDRLKSLLQLAITNGFSKQGEMFSGIAFKL